MATECWPRIDRVPTVVGSSPAARSSREVELGASLGPGVDISDKYRLHVYRATIVHGEPVRREHAELRWFTAAELVEADWLVPDRPFVRALRYQL